MTGNHERPPARFLRAAVVLLALSMAGVGAVLIVSAMRPSSQASPASPSVSTAASLEPSNTTSLKPSNTTSLKPSTTGSSTGSTPSALVACQREVAAGDALAAAADMSYRHWSTHVRAETDLEGGTISAATAKRMWETTKAAGPGDLTRFAAAEKAYTAAAGACATLGRVEPATDKVVADPCRTRAKALASVADSGAKVNGMWSSHITMMAEKPMTDPKAYGKRWRQMVADAPKVFDPYKAAAAKLAAAPTCPA